MAYDVLIKNARICDGSGAPAYGGVSYEESERSLRLFASEVMPRLQQLGERAVA